MLGLDEKIQKFYDDIKNKINELEQKKQKTKKEDKKKIDDEIKRLEEKRYRVNCKIKIIDENE